MANNKLNNDIISHFIDNDLYIPTRTIYIGPIDVDDFEVNCKMAERAIKNLHILDSKSNEPIEIIMLNYGGEVTAGMAIYDAIKLCRSFVTIKVFGTASSMGSIILQSADKRLLAPNAEVMIHFGTSSFGPDHPKIIKSAVKRADNFDNWMINLYLEKIHEKLPTFTKAALDGWLNFDKYFSPQEAIDAGLADGIIESHKDK